MQKTISNFLYRGLSPMLHSNQLSNNAPTGRAGHSFVGLSGHPEVYNDYGEQV